MGSSAAARATTVLLLILLGSASARAQPYPPGDIERARDHFRAGVEASRDAHWLEARLSFSRAYALVPLPQTLFNLARAQAETGQLVMAVEGYRRFLREASESTNATLRETAEHALTTLGARIGSVRLNVAGMLDTDVILLDRAPPTRAIGQDTPIDPGPHLVIVTRDDVEVARAAFTVAEAEAISVPLNVPGPPSPPRRNRPEPARTRTGAQSARPAQ
jgi:tetratricopeptide (TPR) repeat protein